MIVYDALPEKAPAKSVAVALGMFDGLHLGHLAVLNALVKEAGTSPRCVFTFSTTKDKPDAKTREHLLTREARDALLEKTGIDYVFQPEFSDFREMSPDAFARDFICGYLGAESVFCGEDFRFGKKASAGADELKKLLPEDVKLCLIPLVNNGGAPVSTTRIRECVKSGDMQGAEEMLGRAFSFDFTVIHGRKLGRRLNWPTINQAFPADFVIPKFGVYASFTIVNGKRHVSVTNVGVKPTVGSGQILVETYIHDFSGDLYGLNVPVELKQYIRPERKFGSIDELKAQIESDNKRAGEILSPLVGG